MVSDTHEEEDADTSDPFDDLLRKDPVLAVRLLAGDLDAWKEAAMILARDKRYQEDIASDPCTAVPGSWQKVEFLQHRLQGQQSLFNRKKDVAEDDRCGFRPEQAWDAHDSGQHWFRDGLLVQDHEGIKAVAEDRPVRRGRMRTAQEHARSADPAFRAAEAARKREARQRARVAREQNGQGGVHEAP